jgi:hypothetical protein
MQVTPASTLRHRAEPPKRQGKLLRYRWCADAENESRPREKVEAGGRGIVHLRPLLYLPDGSLRQKEVDTAMYFAIDDATRSPGFTAIVTSIANKYRGRFEWHRGRRHSGADQTPSRLPARHEHAPRPRPSTLTP